MGNALARDKIESNVVNMADRAMAMGIRAEVVGASLGVDPRWCDYAKDGKECVGRKEWEGDGYVQTTLRDMMEDDEKEGEDEDEDDLRVGGETKGVEVKKWEGWDHRQLLAEDVAGAYGDEDGEEDGDEKEEEMKRGGEGCETREEATMNGGGGVTGPWEMENIGWRRMVYARYSLDDTLRRTNKKTRRKGRSSKKAEDTMETNGSLSIEKSLPSVRLVRKVMRRSRDLQSALLPSVQVSIETNYLNI